MLTPFLFHFPNPPGFYLGLRVRCHRSRQEQPVDGFPAGACHRPGQESHERVRRLRQPARLDSECDGAYVVLLLLLLLLWCVVVVVVGGVGVAVPFIAVFVCYVIVAAGCCC